MTEEKSIRRAAFNLLSDVDGYKLRKGVSLFIEEVRANIASYKSTSEKELFLEEAIQQINSSINRHRAKCSKGESCPTDQKMQQVHSFLYEEMDDLLKLKTKHMLPTNDFSPKQVEHNNTSKKVFISHASANDNITLELVELLELIGVPSNKIFYSSHPYYGIAPGENFLDRIKSEIDSEVLILFALSPQFFASPVCLCEMGAAWALSKTHIPIVIPPFSFAEIKGVIPLTQGIKITESLQVNAFAKKIVSLFNLKPIEQIDNWEGKRTRILSRIDALIHANK